MRNFIKALILAFSFFSRLPMPRIESDKRSISSATLFLPMVGFAIGFCEAVMMYAGYMIKAPVLCLALCFILIPTVFTGGIHLDGLIDTADAKNSYGDMEKRHAILKDPHVGAFGIIRLAMYLMAALAVLIFILENTKMPVETALVLFAMPFVVSRSLLGVIVFWFKAYEASDGSKGMLWMLKEGQSAPMKYIAVAEAVCALVVVFFWLPTVKAIATVTLQLVLFMYFKYFSMRDFDGVSGDLCGWFLCMSELAFGIGVIL